MVVGQFISMVLQCWFWIWYMEASLSSYDILSGCL